MKLKTERDALDGLLAFMQSYADDTEYQKRDIGGKLICLSRLVERVERGTEVYFLDWNSPDGPSDTVPKEWAEANAAKRYLAFPAEEDPS